MMNTDLVRLGLNPLAMTWTNRIALCAVMHDLHILRDHLEGGSVSHVE
jgi:hypothetical protein